MYRQQMRKRSRRAHTSLSPRRSQSLPDGVLCRNEELAWRVSDALLRLREQNRLAAGLSLGVFLSTLFALFVIQSR